MSNKEKCIAILDGLAEDQPANIAAIFPPLPWLKKCHKPLEKMNEMH